jgi:hypothetical protein
LVAVIGGPRVGDSYRRPRAASKGLVEWTGAGQDLPLFGEEMLDAPGSCEGDDVERRVGGRGEGVRSPLGHPGEVAFAGGDPLGAELELQPAGDHEEAFVDLVVRVQDRTRGPAGQGELADAESPGRVAGDQLQRQHRVLDARLSGRQHERLRPICHLSPPL